MSTPASSSDTHRVVVVSMALRFQGFDVQSAANSVTKLFSLEELVVRIRAQSCAAPGSHSRHPAA